MINLELKEKFAEFYLADSSSHYAKYILPITWQCIGDLEDELGRDCSTFSKEELLKALTSYQANNHGTLNNIKSLLNAYCNYLKIYCNQTDVQNAAAQISGDEIRGCISAEAVASKYLSHKAFEDIVHGLKNDTDKALLYVIWFGLHGDEWTDVTFLTENDVDYKNCTITIKEKQWKVNEQCCVFLRSAFYEQWAVSYGSSIDRHNRVFGDGRLYKESSSVQDPGSAHTRRKWLTAKFSAIKKEFELPVFVPSTIHDSGFLHHAKQGMAVFNKTFREYLYTTNGQMLIGTYYGLNQDVAGQVSALNKKFKAYL